MKPSELADYREQLLSLRRRMSAEINHLASAVRETAAADAGASSAPLHLADRAPTGLEADTAVLQVSDDNLTQIDAALERIANQTFGRCSDCGRPIAAARLSALPQTPYCGACAAARAKSLPA